MIIYCVFISDTLRGSLALVPAQFQRKRAASEEEVYISRFNPNVRIRMRSDVDTPM